jgi:hypothetical protein
LFARVTTPFLVAPGLALITVQMYANSPSVGRGVALAAMGVAMVLVPFGLEIAGVVSRTTEIIGRDLVLHPAAAELAPALTLAALVLYVVVVIGLASVLPRSLANERRALNHKLQLQAWQLRQLVPT